MVRWPGNIPAGSVSNGIVSHQDWFPTLLAAAGVPDVKEKLLQGYKAGDKSYKVHLDGYNMLDYFRAGGEGDGSRKDFYYFTDQGDLSAIRYNNWKILFSEQRAHGLAVWADPLVPLRWPIVTNLRSDPFERASHESIGWAKWAVDRMFVLVPAQAVARQFLETFIDFPPRQTPASFSIDQVLKQMQEAQSGANR
jgi:arylsulfatase